MFSLRVLLERVVYHGKKALIQTTRAQKQYSTKFKLTESHVEESGRKVCHQNNAGAQELIVSSTASRGNLFQYLAPVTLRFLQGVVRKVPSPLWAAARRKNAKQLFGATAPYFALVGVTLVSGPERGLLTEKDELEALCGDIREAISRVGWIHNPDFWVPTATSEDKKSKIFSLADFELGSVIDKGCNAVVYEAKWKNATKVPKTNPEPMMNPGSESPPEESSSAPIRESLNLNRMEALDLEGLSLTSTLSSLVPPMAPLPRHGSVNDLLISGGFGGFQQPPKRRTKNKSLSQPDDFPLAVKMMFNYEAESYAPAILTAMRKELLPASHIQQHIFDGQLSNQLPPHPNVVLMPCVFVDRVPLLEGGIDLYPQALPQRLNPGGFGRNMSLFCVMKRYSCSMSVYLSDHSPSVRTSCLLLTQLLEGLQHLQKFSVAHRDLKLDNLLVDLNEGGSCPRLVVSDFGCCIAVPSMTAPFPSPESDPRMGNLALMAPEVRGAIAGVLSHVNFSRSDVWAAGALALDFFGLHNPFAGGELSSLSYRDAQCPKLPKDVPHAFRSLVAAMLRRKPNQRPSARVAATVAHVALWGPSKWLNKHALLLPSHNEVMRWLLCVSTKVLCEAGGCDTSQGGLEYEMVSAFLRRVHYEHIIEALEWIRSGS